MPSLRLHAHDYRDTIALRQLLEGCQDSSRWGSPKSKIAGVIHFAGYKAVEESIREPLKYYANNVSGLIDFVTTLGDFGIKTFIHVTDLARGHISALNAASNGVLKENFRAFNLGAGYGHSVMEVVRAMEDASAKHIPTRGTGRRLGDVGSCVADATRSHDELQWETEKRLKDACVDSYHFLNVSGLSS